MTSRKADASNYKSEPSKKYRWCIIAAVANNSLGYKPRKWWSRDIDAIAAADELIQNNKQARPVPELTVVRAEWKVGPQDIPIKHERL